MQLPLRPSPAFAHTGFIREVATAGHVGAQIALQRRRLGALGAQPGGVREKLGLKRALGGGCPNVHVKIIFSKIILHPDETRMKTTVVRYRI